MSIIFLNGTTSAGKTSIARCLQEKLDAPYLYIGIDDAFAMLPTKFHNHSDGFFFDRNDNGLIRLNFGGIGLSLLKSHQSAVAAISAAGMNMICDEVVLNDEIRMDWLEVLRPFQVTFVGVHCSLDELERREKARGDRVIGQARGQYNLIHQRMRYHIEVDTTDTSSENAAEQIIEFLSDS